MQIKKNIKWMSLTFLLAASLAGCSLVKSSTPTPAEAAMVVEDSSTVSVTGVVVPKTYASLGMAAQGIVENVLVSEGQTVSEGQELVSLSNRAQAEATQASAQLELESAQQAYDDFNRNADINHAADWQAYIDAQNERIAAEKRWQDLKDDNIEDKITDREVTLQERKDDLETAQEEFDKYNNLDKENATRKRAENELEDAQKAYDQAKWDLEESESERDTAQAELDRTQALETEAKRQYQLTLDAPDTEQLALLEARLSNAKSQVTAAEQNLANVTLLAPFAGTVAEVNINPGEWASSGQPVIVLADLTSLRIETTDLNEVDITKIQTGDTANITFDALPDTTITGVVTRMAPKASPGSGVNYTVVIEMDEIPELLRWGMTAYLDFALGN